jgi:hypothetical protein
MRVELRPTTIKLLAFRLAGRWLGGHGSLLRFQRSCGAPLASPLRACFAAQRATEMGRLRGRAKRSWRSSAYSKGMTVDASNEN